MAITFSHPALSIPLRRIGLDLSALIVGSMAPDFEFFIRLSPGRSIGHTLLGLPLFVLPVGLVILFVFHKIIKHPVMSLLPHHHQLKLFEASHQYTFGPPKRFLLICLSLLIGGLSHLGWDAFTHADGMINQLFPVLNTPILHIGGATMRLYFAFQYVSSALGLVLMGYWYYKWHKMTPAKDHIVSHRLSLAKRIMVGAAIGVFACGGGIVAGFLSIPNFSGIQMIKEFVSHSTVASVSSFMVAVCTFGAMWHYLVPHHKRTRFVKKITDEVVESTVK